MTVDPYDFKTNAVIEHNEEGDIQVAFRILQGAIADGTGREMGREARNP